MGRKSHVMGIYRHSWPSPAVNVWAGCGYWSHQTRICILASYICSVGIKPWSHVVSLHAVPKILRNTKLLRLLARQQEYSLRVSMHIHPASFCRPAVLGFRCPRLILVFMWCDPGAAPHRVYVFSFHCRRGGGCGGLCAGEGCCQLLAPREFCSI